MNIFKKNEDDEAIRRYIKNQLASETGKERLLKMFSRNEYGMLSPELLFITKTATSTFTMIAVVGGFIHIGKARDDFLRKDAAAAYESEYLARRKLTDTMSIAGIKGAVKYGVRYGTFSTLYLLMTMSAASYNNKVTVWEHIGAGALLGGLTRINYGLKGTAAAGLAGGFLGMVAGTIILSAIWMTGFSMDEFRFYNYKYYEKQFIKKRKDVDNDDPSLTRRTDHRVF